MRLPQAFGEWEMEAGKMEVLLVVSRIDVDRSAEAQLVNMYVNIKEGYIGGGYAQVNCSACLPHYTLHSNTMYMCNGKMYFRYIKFYLKYD